MWKQGYSRICYPLTILPTFEGNLNNKKKAFGKADQRLVAHFFDNKMEAYYDADLEDYFNGYVLKKILQEKGFMDEVEKKIHAILSRLLKFSSRLAEDDLFAFSDIKLVKLLRKFNALYADIFSYGLINTYDKDIVECVKSFFVKNYSKDKALRYFIIFISV